MKAISFDAISIAAIRQGHKTMTRRPLGRYRRWFVGDEAWVKVEWIDEQGKERPAIFCPRRCSPFSIRITAHRMEYLRAITAEDVEREGLDVARCLPHPEMVALRLFEERWDSIYGKMPGKRWRANPLLEVLTFQVITEDK